MLQICSILLFLLSICLTLPKVRQQPVRLFAEPFPPRFYLFFATVLLITYWGCTIGAPLTKKGCWQESKSAQIPVVNSSYLASCGLAVMSQPSVGHIQPSMELLDQAWKLDVLWPQTRLDAQTLQNVEQLPMGTSVRLHIQQ